MKHIEIGPICLVGQVDYHQDCLSRESVHFPGCDRHGSMG
jgi:hypothetical protein